MLAPKLIKIEDYTYNLPDNRIAKYPLTERDESKLLVYLSGKIQTERFLDVTSHIPENSLILWNDSRVLNARIIFHKTTGARIEVFCISPASNQYEDALNSTETVEWHCIIGNLKKWKSGFLEKQLKIDGENLLLKAELISKEEKYHRVRFHWDNTAINFGQILDFSGLIPIPPYLNRESELIDKERYQTLYSKPSGSVAAPTAGLHFTNSVIQALKEKKIQQHHITLHVGTGTFQPVKTNTIGEHPMHTEYFHVSKISILAMLENYGNITCVGTTTVRGIESVYQAGINAMTGKISLSDTHNITQWEAYDKEESHHPREVLEWIISEMERLKISEIKGKTSIMIAPGYKFHYTNRLITNFHQPKSTLLLLIAAFIGDAWHDVYQYALENQFRFLSYGDSSLLIP
jgi:S-adenosylmethionine:tRNA ribosyltransferase-isomerase